MPATIEQLTHEALALSDTERAHLAQTLLRSLEPGSEEGVDEAWATEVTLRAERVREGTAQGRPADEVFREIRARLQP
jgi:putative addiction module component (TIGR02574 family)